MDIYPTTWANSIPFSKLEVKKIAALRKAGCTDDLPLLGYRMGYGPRCRLCNTQAERPDLPYEDDEAREIANRAHDNFNAILREERANNAL